MNRYEDRAVGRSGISALAELAAEQFRKAERLEPEWHDAVVSQGWILSSDDGEPRNG